MLRITKDHEPPKTGYKFHAEGLGIVRVFANDIYAAIKLLRRYTTAKTRYIGK